MENQSAEKGKIVKLTNVHLPADFSDWDEEKWDKMKKKKCNIGDMLHEPWLIKRNKCPITLNTW